LAGEAVHDVRHGLEERHGIGSSDALQRRYENFHFKGITTKEWSPRQYQAKIAEIKEKIAGRDCSHNFSSGALELIFPRHVP
jgi:hypothetical protein